MTDFENEKNRVIKKITKPFKKKEELLYLYKNYVFNERIKDLIVLRYDLDKPENNANDENALSASLNIYPEIPKKLSFLVCLKYRKAIQNFIIYQYSKYAETFVERKILKETKKDVFYIYKKQQLRYLMAFYIISSLLMRSANGFLLVSCSVLFSYKFDTLGNFIFLLNLNDLLMKYQINTFYILGKETRDFVNYIENQRKENNFEFMRNNKDYYDKFFVNDVYEVKFEKNDKIVDYLKAENVLVDYHNQSLNRLQSDYKEKNDKL
jgi:hypothetical protein